MSGVKIYWETLRHLRPIQFYGRVWHKFYRPAVDRTSASTVSRHKGLWVSPISRPFNMEGAFQFRFLNHSHTLPKTGGWEEVSFGKLWLYNLHYFDDLNAENADERTKWHGLGALSHISANCQLDQVGFGGELYGFRMAA